MQAAQGARLRGERVIVLYELRVEAGGGERRAISGLGKESAMYLDAGQRRVFNNHWGALNDA